MGEQDSTEPARGADDMTVRMRRSALVLFNEVGFGSATVDMIAERADAGIASLYRRWQDKAALANDLYEDFVGEMHGLMDLDEDASGKDRFLVFWHRVWNFAFDDPERLLFVENQAYASFLSEENLALKHQLMARAVDICAGLGLGVDADLACAMLMGTVVSVLRLEVAPDPDELGERLWIALSAS